KASRTGVCRLTTEGRHQAAAPAALDLLDIVLDEAEHHPAAASERPPQPTPEHLRRFLGRYQLWGGAVTHVECRAGDLKLTPAPPDQFSLHAPARLAPTGDPLVFRVTQGRAAGEHLRFQAAGDD